MLQDLLLNANQCDNGKTRHLDYQRQNEYEPNLELVLKWYLSILDGAEALSSPMFQLSKTYAHVNA